MSADPYAITFEPVPGSRSVYVRCRICHSYGQPGSPSSSPKWWGHKHTSHKFKCTVCGKLFPTGQGVANHMRLSKEAGHVETVKAIGWRVWDTNWLTNEQLLAQMAKTAQEPAPAVRTTAVIAELTVDAAVMTDQAAVDRIHEQLRRAALTALGNPDRYVSSNLFNRRPGSMEPRVTFRLEVRVR